MNVRLLLAALGFTIMLARAAPAQPATNSLQQVRHFDKNITVRVQYNYWLFLPKGYSDHGKRWPLMLFLHGAGDAGTNLERVRILGPPKIVESQPDFPFILVSPQSPVRSWDLDALNALLEDVIHRYHADKDRIYLTGASMGGSGTWALAAAHPEKFAAIAPVCGTGNPADAPKLAQMPIWIFHGAKDPVVPLAHDQAMFDALKAAGNHAKFTIYPNAKHDAWTETYNNPELYQWLLEQKRR
jgi:predicted peptidase